MASGPSIKADRLVLVFVICNGYGADEVQNAKDPSAQVRSQLQHICSIW